MRSNLHLNLLLDRRNRRLDPLKKGPLLDPFRADQASVGQHFEMLGGSGGADL